MWQRGRQCLAALALACGAASGIMGCGSSNPSTSLPVSPSPTSPRLPVVQASVATVPLEAKPAPQGTGPVKYEISAAITLRETAGVPGYVTAIDATFMSANGFSSAERFNLAVDLDEFSTSTVSVTQKFETTSPVDPGVWRLTGRGTSDEGDAFLLASIEVPVTIRSAAPQPSQPPQPPPPPPAAPDVTIAAAGDIAVCGSVGTEETARLLDRLPGPVLTLGDNVYPRATAQTFRDCFEPTWGRHKARMRPSPGNHDWEEHDGAAYFSYFGISAGPPGLGYYSYDLGNWHIVALNSNLSSGPSSGQLAWLRTDLAANASACTLAYWHHPVFSSGPNGGHGHMRDVWNLLYERGVDVVLNGHDHNYERFARQDADGRPSARGIRQFIVGTGGAPLYWRRGSAPTSEVFDSTSWGVLKMTLKALSFDWEFVPTSGGSFRDSGSSACVF